MKINERQTLARKRITKISFAVQEAVDKICQEENFDITYSEINCALLEVLKSFNGFELKELFKESE